MVVDALVGHGEARTEGVGRAAGRLLEALDLGVLVLVGPGFLLAVGLTEQGVEAVVEAGAEAQAGGMAGTGNGAVLVLPLAPPESVVLEVVLEVVLLEGLEQSGLVHEHRAVLVQAAGPTVTGLVASQWDHDREAALTVVSPAVEQPLLALQPLPLPGHAPLTLPQPLQALLVLLQLAVQLLALATQPLRLQVALTLPLLQHTLLLPLLFFPSLTPTLDCNNLIIGA